MGLVVLESHEHEAAVASGDNPPGIQGLICQEPGLVDRAPSALAVSRSNPDAPDLVGIAAARQVGAIAGEHDEVARPEGEGLQYLKVREPASGRAERLTGLPRVQVSGERMPDYSDVASTRFG